MNQHKKKHDFPILYIQSNGKLRFWHIWIISNQSESQIFKEYGILEGKHTKTKPVSVKNGKNKTHYELAYTKARSLWDSKKKNGFVEKNKNYIQKKNVIKPMRAHKLDEYSHKIIYPAFVQKKLDGFRCLANNHKLYSRGMTEFPHLNHIKKEIDHLNLPFNIYLDGELYEEHLTLHNISSLSRKIHVSNENIEKMKDVSFYVFDMFDLSNMSLSFEKRYEYLIQLFQKNPKLKHLKLVECYEVSDFEEIEKYNDQFMSEGYEGIIVRNKKGIYEWNMKSYNVLRTKQVKHSDFFIKNAKEGNGTQKGAIIWEIECKKKKNKTFYAIPLGTIQNRIQLYSQFLKNKNQFIGKKVKIKYFNDNSNGCVIRNPIVVEIL